MFIYQVHDIMKKKKVVVKREDFDRRKQLIEMALVMVRKCFVMMRANVR